MTTSTRLSRLSNIQAGATTLTIIYSEGQETVSRMIVKAIFSIILVLIPMGTTARIVTVKYIVEDQHTSLDLIGMYLDLQ